MTLKKMSVISNELHKIKKTYTCLHDVISLNLTAYISFGGSIEKCYVALWLMRDLVVFDPWKRLKSGCLSISCSHVIYFVCVCCMLSHKNTNLSGFMNSDI